MKINERTQALLLRKQGKPLGEIAKQLGVAKSSVSNWVRSVPLTLSQQQKLQRNSHSWQAIELRRTSRIKRHEAERLSLSQAAYKQAASFLSNPLWCVAVALYWGEGGKTQRTIRISNSVPEVVRLLMHFFRTVCDVPSEKFRGHVHAFAHSDTEIVERYWAKVSGIPRQQFFKTYKKNSTASLSKRRTLPHGTLQIYVHDTTLFIKMMAWISYLKDISHYD